MSDWKEIGDRVFVNRYEFWDQNIGVILGDDAALLIDTRTTTRHAREILEDLKRLTKLPVEFVVDTHGHSDHAFGNSVFRPATIWAHAGCAPFLERTGKAQRDGLIKVFPDMAEDLREVVIDLPDESFVDQITLEVGGRYVDLRYLGRGHTDHDAVVVVPGADVVFAGDLLEDGAIPFFGDGYPLDWPDTAEKLTDLVTGVVVPGHGELGDNAWAREQRHAFQVVADLGLRVAAGDLAVEAALASNPYPAYPAAGLREPIERAVLQSMGGLDGDPPTPKPID